MKWRWTETAGSRGTRRARGRSRSRPLPVRDGAELRAPIAFHAASEREWLGDASGDRVAAVVRSWRSLGGELSLRCERVADGAFRIAAGVRNTTDWCGEDRQDALRSTFASTHMVLHASGADFVSLTDPPAPPGAGGAVVSQSRLVAGARRRAGRAHDRARLADHPARLPCDRSRESGRPVRWRRDRRAALAPHPGAQRRGEGGDARDRPAHPGDPGAHDRARGGRAAQPARRLPGRQDG